MHAFLPAGLTLVLLASSAGFMFFAGLLRGYTGFGFNLVAVPLLTLLRKPAEVVPVVMLLQIVVSFSGLRPALRHCDWRSVGLLSIGGIGLTPVGAWALTWLPANVVRLAIALMVAAAVLVLRSGRRLAARPSRLATFGFGAASGFSNGLIALPGPPVIAYFLGLPSAAAVGRASMIVFFGLTAAIGLLPLALLGLLTRASFVTALVCIPTVWAGSALGSYAFARSSERHYRRVGLTVLTMMAALAALKAWSGMAG